MVRGGGGPEDDGPTGQNTRQINRREAQQDGSAYITPPHTLYSSGVISPAGALRRSMKEYFFCSPPLRRSRLSWLIGWVGRVEWVQVSQSRAVCAMRTSVDRSKGPAHPSIVYPPHQPPTHLLVAPVVLDDLDGVAPEEDLLVAQLLAQRVPQVVALQLFFWGALCMYVCCCCQTCPLCTCKCVLGSPAPQLPPAPTDRPMGCTAADRLMDLSDICGRSTATIPYPPSPQTAHSPCAPPSLARPPTAAAAAAPPSHPHTHVTSRTLIFSILASFGGAPSPASIRSCRRAATARAGASRAVGTKPQAPLARASRSRAAPALLIVLG